jgi:class 3 adenylate cyclase
LRVLGATVARLAEAISSMIRTSQPKMWLGLTGDELATAQAYREVAQFVPRVGAMIDAVHRHHLVSTRTFIEGVQRGPSAGLLCGVGFADLSGFTALTQKLTPAELSAMLTEFGATVSDLVHADGGRVVKFLGDAVMWVSSDPERLAQAALDLVDHPRAREAGMQVRAGLGYGEILALSGDYFGNAVNLAARLVAAAAPGQILAAAEVRERLPHWPATAQEPLQLKGFDAPVIAYELGRAEA